MKRLLTITLLLSSLGLLRAHLCNDVFEQARDNLAVKVDIRDGQLRIHQEASFRVYLLNTMDRGIADIRLEVISPDFDSIVTPSPEWRTFPQLNTIRHGGKKEYFTVTLKRKAGVPDGRYQIALRLFNGKQPRMEFKTVELDRALNTISLPLRPRALQVDGRIQREEWADAWLCTGFSQDTKGRRYIEVQPADCGTRIRLAAQADTLYAMIAAPAVGENDTVDLLITPDMESAPTAIRVHLSTGTMEKAPPGARAEKGPEGIELSIPLQPIGIQQAFLLNIIRQRDQRLSYWLGNEASCQNPLVFARILLPD